MTGGDHAIPIGGDQITTGDWIEVRAPYDGALLGRVPAAGGREIDLAVGAARASLSAGALPHGVAPRSSTRPPARSPSASRTSPA